MFLQNKPNNIKFHNDDYLLTIRPFINNYGKNQYMTSTIVLIIRKCSCNELINRSLTGYYGY